MFDKRKNNKGTKGNKGGRPRKLPITAIIEKHCEKFIIDLLNNEAIKSECLNQRNKREGIIKGKSFLYIIKSNGFYKIGITSNIKNRFKVYSSHSAYTSELMFSKIITNANDLEKELINKYSSYCCKGDWFDFSESILLEIIAYISSKDL
tara:strand:+ start:1175 stop:1624 length:450 start_codon:yes stop_codon:yes gene_type:complete